MSILSPAWLAILGIVPLYLLSARKSGWSVTRKTLWLLASIVLAGLALARPVISQKPVETSEVGSDVVIGIDLSFSMRAQDESPSRLEAAKKVLVELVRSDHRDRFGVMGFTTSAIVLSPLTKDTELLEHLFAGVDESQIITKGTTVMGALELARKMSHAKKPVVILLTDGGDETSYEKEAEFARDNGLVVTIMLLGSSSGSTIPQPDGMVLKDEAGHIVVSSRNDKISEISQITDGRIVYGPDARALSEAIDSARHADFQGSTKINRYQELFYIPLIMALIAFLLAFTRLGGKQIGTIIMAGALNGTSAQAGMFDFVELYLARKNYDEGHFEHSAELYRRIDTPQARYNRANGLYKAGKYEEALSAYRSVRSDDPAFKSVVYYNMGNCFIRLQEFQKARESLLKSLTLRYTNEAAQNYCAIADAQEQDFMVSGRQKGEKRADEQTTQSNESKGSKQGGGSNMKSDMASGGGGDEGKKTQSDPRLSMAQGKARLSSRQYELINQRSVHETKPW